MGMTHISIHGRNLKLLISDTLYYIFFNKSVKNKKKIIYHMIRIGKIFKGSET